ncbi:hypothetical protein H311_02615 [Anncaliia algerae PRA109]|nr:hypothetical protein H311_02615 [Anncaliia algerae PRA109]
MSLSIIKLRIHIAAFTIVIYLYLLHLKFYFQIFNFPLKLPNAFSTRILCYDKLNSSAEVKGGLANIDLQMRIFFLSSKAESAIMWYEGSEIRSTNGRIFFFLYIFASWHSPNP